MNSSSIKTISELAAKVEEIVDKCKREGVLFNSCKAKHLVEGYCGEDWKDSVQFSKERYNRVQLYCGENFDIWLICWGVGQESGVHDHPENGCVQKMLQGGLGETRYIKKEDGKYCKWRRRVYAAGDVGYICGKRGIHLLKNIGDVGAVTLHLYSPPNYLPRIIAV